MLEEYEHKKEFNKWKLKHKFKSDIYLGQNIKIYTISCVKFLNVKCNTSKIHVNLISNSNNLGLFTT